MAEIEEVYKAKRPGRIFMAEEEFFRLGEKRKKKRKVIDFEPPEEFQMGIVLERSWYNDEKRSPMYDITLYFAPEQDLDSYLNYEEFPGMKFQSHRESLFMTDYRIIADEKQETVETGAYMSWGELWEFYSGDENTEKIEAAYMKFGVPEQEAFKKMRKMIYSLFKDVRVWKKEIDNIDEIVERFDQRRIARELQDAQGTKCLEELYQNENLIHAEFLLPLQGTFFSDEEEDPSKGLDLDEKGLIPYKKEIEKRAEWINNQWRNVYTPPLNMMTAYDERDSLKEKAIRGDVSIKEENGLYVCTTLILKEALTTEDIEELKEYLLEMYAECWGTSFYNRSLDLDDGELRMYFADWECTDFIYRQVGPPYRSKEESKAKQEKKKKQKNGDCR